jgi:hypothetical protein
VRLIAMNYRLAVCRFDPWQPPPQWALTSPFFSVTRSADELSVICDARDVPPGVEARTGLAALRVAGALDPEAVGVLASLLAPLAASEIPVMTVSTHDTDYLLVPSDRLADARRILADAGHVVDDPTPQR